MAATVPYPWKTNIMGILGDCRVLFASVLCPALSYYATSELFESPPAGVIESCIGGYCLCCGFYLRTKLRQKYNLDGSLLGDFIAHLCCHCVAMARIWREAEIQLEAGKQQPQQMQPLQPPQQNVVQLPPQQMQPMQPMQQPFVVQSPAPQQFIHPGLQQIQPIHQVRPIQPIGFVDPYQQRPIFMPQQAIMVQQQPDHQNTVDTNLSSDFDSRNDDLLGRETASYSRNDSIDPPPSNTDPDPWSMMPALHASSRRPVPQPLIQEAQAEEQHHPEKKRMPSKKRPETANVPYEQFVANEMADVRTESPQSPFAGQRPAADDLAPKTNLITERLSRLRPGSGTKPTPQVGESFKGAKDSGELVDEIVLGGNILISHVNVPKEIEAEEHTSHEDPPQHWDRSGSMRSKHDDSSLLTYGATVGSELHTSMHLLSKESNKQKEEDA